MKILKVKTASGFKMLEPGFEINFLTKTRIDKESINDDLILLEDDLYYPIETILIGKNSSGKTTALELLLIAIEILNNGRVEKNHFEFSETFSIEIVFYANGVIYKYEGGYSNNTIVEKACMSITHESLTKTTFKESYKKDLSNASFFKVADFKDSIGTDNSRVINCSADGSFNYSLDLLKDKAHYFNLFYTWLGETVFMSLVRLFDDSVEILKPVTDTQDLKHSFVFKRINSKTIIVDSNTLEKLLSKGTVRGINLYALSLLTFRSGGHLLVDEIEGSFNRNLIENLFVMYKDKSINARGGSIIYSTHYSELLDCNNRCDNVNVLHREGDVIKLKNMHSDYNVRTDMIKSSQFNQNTFDTLVNYDRLMELKEAIRDSNKA